MNNDDNDDRSLVIMLLKRRKIIETSKILAFKCGGVCIAFVYVLLQAGALVDSSLQVKSISAGSLETK